VTPSVLSNLFPAWPVSVDPLAMGALALVLAAVCGELVFRFLRLPRITGYSLAGLVAGPSLLGWIGADVGVGGMRLLIDLSLALLLFELGVRVNLRWFRHNPMILASSVAEAALAFVAVFLVVTLLGYQLEIALVVATVSMTTSRSGFTALIFCSASMPSMPGIFTSSTTTSSSWAVTVSRASCPEWARWTVSPRRERRFPKVSMNSASSSTNKTLHVLTAKSSWARRVLKLLFTSRNARRSWVWPFDRAGDTSRWS